MPRRKWIIAVLLLAVFSLAGVYGVLWLTAPTPGLTEENALRLRAGMTLQEVENIFAFSGSHLSTFRFKAADVERKPYFWVSESELIIVSKSYCWRNKNGLFVTVDFDNGALRNAAIGISEINVNESFLEWVRRVLRL